MKKTITSSLIVVLMLFVCRFSFGQTDLEKDYAKIKSEYISKHNDYLKNISFTNIPEPQDPLANFIEGPDGNLIPASANSHGNSPFVAPYPIGPGKYNVNGLYNFSQSTQTYNTIAGGTVVASGGSIDDNTYPGQPIGFTFHFNNTPYTTLGIDANGYIWFGAVTPASGDRSAISMTVAVDGAVSPMSYDMLSLNPAGEIRIQTQGSAPNRTCTVQFKNWTSYTVQTDTLNFQVILYETSDSISIMYGYCNKDVTSRSVQVGMRGATNADFQSRTTATSWAATTAGVNNTDACTLVNTIYPSNGLTFTYKLPTPGNMTYMSSNTVQVTPGAPVIANSTNNPIIQIQVVDTGSLSPISISSLKLETTGSNNPSADILNAKVYYTGTVNSFNTTTPFGSVVNNPSGVFYVSGSQVLAPNATNYFWVTYDIKPGAVVGDSVDAQCDSLIGSGTMGGRVPTTVAPAGSRPVGSPLCGNYTIPGSFPTIAAAINALNTIPVTCPVVFNVAAGYTETAANLVITGTGTAVNTVTFRKSGSGANPLITAGVGTGLYDGIIKFYGVNYITFDGIDLQESAANVTQTTQMEWGYALLRPDATHGDNFNSIKNCNITLNKTNYLTSGIYSNYMNLAGTTTIPTTPAGTSGNNSFINVNITNSQNGFYLNSSTDGTFPFTLEDHDNIINTSGSGRSSVTNFASSSSFGYGVYAYYQSNFTCNNTYINSRGGINTNYYMYGIYNYHYYDNGNSTIIGDTITLVDTTGSTGYLYGIYNYCYYGNNDNVSNNVVKDFVNPSTSTTNYYLYNYCASGSQLYRTNITITGNKVFNNHLGVAGTSTGTDYHYYLYSYSSNSVNISNNLDSANVVLGTSCYTPYNFYCPGASNNVVFSGNRIVNDTICGTTAASTSYGLYYSIGLINSSMDSNVVANNVMPTTGAHSYYCMYNTSTAAASNDFSYNTVNNNFSSGAGTIYGMYYSASPAFGSTVNITNNTITNLQKYTATGAGSIFGIYQGSTPQGTLNINNNTITGFNSIAATAMYGIYQASSPPNYLNINGNKVGNFTNGGISTIYGIYGASSSTTTQENISQDSVFNIISPGSTIYGIYSSNGNPVNIFRNRVLGLSSNTYTSPSVYGIFIGAGTVVNVYNNFVSDLTAPASTSVAPALTGLYISSGTFVNAYFNTIYLKATSTSATTFGSTGIYASTGPTVDLRNNAVVNVSTPGPTGGNTIAYDRSSSITTTYSVNSNNNCFWAGTPAANKLIYYDGTNLLQTLAAYKTFMTPKDGASATELPPFVNGTTAPYDLRISPSTATQLESGGQVISTSSIPPAILNITSDAFGTARYPNSGYPVGGFTPTAPDIGANEFGGLHGDVAGPLISYTALGIGGTANRTFNNVIITDPSGVNVTTGTKPRCYYKRSTDGNVINDNTSGTDGWKYVESNGATSPFDFTINYALLNGGTGVIAGQIVNYFVIAQDLASTPNVNWNQASFTVIPTTVGLTSGAAPISNTLSYTIGTATFSGVYSVGTAQAYTSLTGVGGIFSAINAGTITGNITISITSDMTEDGTNALNLTNESGPGGYKITIVPATASMKTISGSVAQAMIRFNGSRRVTIDGNGGLGAKYLTFRNYYGTTPTIQYQNEAGMDTLKNCYVESNNTGTLSGTIYIGTTTGVNGNDSICVNSCDIRDRSDVAGTPANAIFGNGSTTTLATYNNYCSVINCNIYNYYYDGGAFTAGVYLNAGCSDWTISGNSFYQTTSRAPANASTFIGAFANTSTENDIIVTNNYFGGSAPLCAGTAMTYSGAGAYSVYGIYLFVGNLVPSSVQNNTIQNINLTYTGASTMNFFRAIWAGTGYVNIGNIAGNTIGSGTGTGSITLTMNTTASTFTIAMIYHAGFGSVMNNTIGSITIGGNSTGSGSLYAGVYWSNTLAGQIYTMTNNLIGSQTTANSIQCTNLVDGHALRGFYILNGAGTVNNVTNNTVANLTSLNTNSLYLCSVYGIQYNTAANAVNTFTGNTVRNLSVNENIAIASFAVGGIFSAGYGSNIFSQNTIYSLYSLGTTGAQLIGGILAGGYYNGGTVSQNKMYDFKMLGTGAGALVLGINVQGYTSYNVTNNMISLTNGDASDSPLKLTEQEKPFKQVMVKNPPVNLSVIQKDESSILKQVVAERNPVMGLVDEHSPEFGLKNKTVKGKNDNANSTNGCQLAGIYFTGNQWNGMCNFYYNTFYIGGAQPGASTYNSADFMRTANGRVSLVNNLFVNARTGGTLNHYCISNEGSLIEGWPVNSANYNVYLTANDNAVGEWGAGNAQTMAGWRTISSGDNQSWETNSTTVAPANLLTSVSTGNLSILTGNAAAWLVSGKGIAIAGQNIDYFGTARVTTIQGGCTDVGAMEFAATPPGNPVATVDNAPGSGVTSTYTLFGRSIAVINWGTGGAYPTAVAVNYYSGVNPSAPNVTTPNATSNSYWTFTPTGSFSGTTYDATILYGDNETYSITSPATNVLMAKNDYNYWMSYPRGAITLQSDNSAAPLTVKTRGLFKLAAPTVVTLTDAVYPAEKPLTPVNAAINQAQALTLVWAKSPLATNYRVQVATDSLFNTIIVNDSTLTDSTKAISGLAVNTRYWWRVNGKFGTTIGGWSQVFYFNTLTVLPPVAPTLFSPANNATGQTLSTLLVWYKSTGATGYGVQVATDVAFTNIILTDTTLTDSTRTVSGLSPLTFYWWRVNAKNVAGTSSYSSAFTFKTMGAASQVTLVNPPNAATGQPINILFTWRRANDLTSPVGKLNKHENITPDNGQAISNYWYELVTDTVSFANLLRDTTLIDTTKNVTGLNYLTTYYWRVKAKNQVGYGAFSGWFRFTTIVLPPALVNMNVIPGGFYNTTTGQLNMRDTLRIYLIDSATCLKLDSAKVVVDSVTFGFQASFGNVTTGPYYIYVFHRNHLPISSNYRQTVTRGSTVSYDFTNDSSKTFGLNVIKVAANKWGMIPGDANQDQFVDGLDQTIWITQNGNDGYLSADFNGDGFADGLDQTIWIHNNGTSSNLPCAFSVPDLLRWEKAQINHKTVGNINFNPINVNVTNKKK